MRLVSGGMGFPQNREKTKHWEKFKTEEAEKNYGNNSHNISICDSFCMGNCVYLFQ